MKTAISLAALLTVVGCSTRPEEPAPQASKPTAGNPSVDHPAVDPVIDYFQGPADDATLLLEPADGTTAVAPDTKAPPPRPALVVSSPSGKPLGNDRLAALSKQLVLVAYPDGTVVDTDVAVTDATDTTLQARIELSPRTALSDRWYAVRLKTVPAEAKAHFPTTGPHHALEAGGGEARFRTGSEPRLRQMVLCPKDDGAVSGVVSYSENIAESSAASFLLTQGAAACDFSQPTMPGTPKTAVTRVDFQFRCTGIDLKNAFAFDTGKLVKSASGSAVGQETYSVDAASLPRGVDSCAIWRRQF
jgi:hypothetical protein